jgi:hypothetical protein
MREMTKSVLGYAFSAPRYGVQQLIASLTESKTGSGEEGAPLSGVTAATVQAAEVLDAMLSAGNTIQDDVIDAGFRALEPETWTPSGMARAAADLSSRMAEGLRYLDPSQRGVAAWRELGNKIEIYRLVKGIRFKLDIPLGRFELPQFIKRCYDLGSFPALWAVEGLGHLYTVSFKPYDENTKGILTAPELAEIPAKTLTMLNAGVGLAFAEELLKPLSDRSAADEVASTLRLYLRLCRQNTRPGYLGAALESLGLVTRTWHAEIMTLVREQLTAIDEVAAQYFWRGVGRALFFLPVNFVPGYGSIANAIRMSRQEATDESARNNTLAGIAWASTVVNMLHPEIMESFLEQHGDELQGLDAFANGVASSLIMRYDTTPDAPFINEFVDREPGGAGSHLASLWQKHIRTPGRDALDKYYPVLRDRGLLGEVFRYQSLADLASDK